ncbi:MAG: hypothetical protein ACFCUU_06980 [Cyclobacteriaceae bacterium]
MKKFFISTAIKRLIKRDKAERYNTPYNEARTFLVVFTAAGNEKIKLVRELEASLKKDNKDVTFLCIQLSEDGSPDVGLDDGMIILDQREINWLGELKNENVRRILQKDYDFLLHADPEHSLITDFILASTKSRCRVGPFEEGKHLIYDLMVKVESSSSSQFFLQQMIRYTKSLN